MIKLKSLLTEISTKAGLTDVIKGRTSAIEGIKMSKDMAQGIMSWINTSPYGRKYGKHILKGRIHSLLGPANAMGIADRLHHKPSELSGGEQQRVSVARALINDPKVILADEPSGNLDSKSAEKLHELFFSLRDLNNQTFVIVTHNNKLADLADKKIIINDGDIN